MRCLALLVGFALLAGACAPTPEAHPATITAGSWQLVSIGGRAVPPTLPVTLAFGSLNLLGNTPCNDYGGGYVYDPSTGGIRMDPIVSTKRACLNEEAAAIETAYLRALQAATDVVVESGGMLSLGSPAGRLAFVALPARTQTDPGPS